MGLGERGGEGHLQLGDDASKPLYFSGEKQRPWRATPLFCSGTIDTIRYTLYTIYVSASYCMCPHATIYVSSYHCICGRIGTRRDAAGRRYWAGCSPPPAPPPPPPAERCPGEVDQYGWRPATKPCATRKTGMVQHKPQGTVVDGETVAGGWTKGYNGANGGGTFYYNHYTNRMAWKGPAKLPFKCTEVREKRESARASASVCERVRE